MRHPVLAALAASLLLAGPIAGCGGGGTAREGAKATQRALRASSSAFRFGTQLTAPGTTLAAAAAAIDDAIRQGSSIATHLDDLANASDPLGLALARAFCTGLSQVASYPDDAAPPTQADWSTFLREQLAIIAPGNPLDLYERTVDQFTTGVDLAQIHPRLAVTYFQQCTRAR